MTAAGTAAGREEPAGDEALRERLAALLTSRGPVLDAGTCRRNPPRLSFHTTALPPGTVAPVHAPAPGTREAGCARAAGPLGLLDLLALLDAGHHAGGHEAPAGRRPRASVSTSVPADAPAGVSPGVSPGVSAWVRMGKGVVGAGRVLTITAGGQDRIEELRAAWRAVVAASWWRDALVRPGTGPLALGTIAFSPASAQPSVLLVPELLIGADEEGGWVTAAALTHQGQQDQGRQVHLGRRERQGHADGNHADNHAAGNRTSGTGPGGTAATGGRNEGAGTAAATGSRHPGPEDAQHGWDSVGGEPGQETGAGTRARAAAAVLAALSRATRPTPRPAPSGTTCRPVTRGGAGRPAPREGDRHPQDAGRTSRGPGRELTVAAGALSEEAWCEAVGTAQARMRAGQAHKVVLARDVVVRPGRHVPVSTLLGRLASAYPSTWAFAVDQTVGATPELLVRLHGRRLASRVLAGTARRGTAGSAGGGRVRHPGTADHDPGEQPGEHSGRSSTEAPHETGPGEDRAECPGEDRAEGPGEDTDALAAWLRSSGKNNREHRLAVDSALTALEPLCSVVSTTPPSPFVLELPNVLHLASDVSGVVAGDTGALALVGALHPTAAVCGTPTLGAASLIDQLEEMDRGRYAGPVGWVDWHGEGEWCIALRCAQLPGSSPSHGTSRGGTGAATDDDVIRVFGGGGIMPDSDPADELAETTAKMRPVLEALEALALETPETPEAPGGS